MQRLIILIVLVIMFCITSTAQTKLTPAFPGAEGCGMYTTGGRGGKVILVTNLNDDGPGSFRKAVKTSGPRTIIFNLSGTIMLTSSLDIRKGDLTIAGQTAPGDGICIAGSGIDIAADNIIIRYIHFRPGDVDSIETDALTIKHSKNVIVDHCSMSWSTDETCSCYDNENFTLQWCIISESLNSSVHSKGEHGYGGIWGGKGATFHHNLLAHHISRNPRLNGSRYHKEPELEKAEIMNNVIYNWRMKCIYAGEDGNYTIRNNYFKLGPASTQKKNHLLEPWKPYSRYNFYGNFVEGNAEISANNTLGVDLKNKGDLPALFVTDTLKFSTFTPDPAIDAYTQVLNHAGASLIRDAVDKRIIEEVRNGTFTYGDNGIINSQTDVGGWPVLKSLEAPTDTDGDGIPDTWEKEQNLNPKDKKDGASFSLNPNYTNLEVYLNSLYN